MTRRAARNAVLVAAGAGLLFLWASLVRSAGPSRKELLAALSEEDRKWLMEYVAPIILPEEEKLFLELTEPHLRERFQREFWARRERDGLQPPLGPGYEARYRELRSRADEVYDGWRSDAGQMVIRWGEPADIYPVQDCQYILRDLEIWTYAGGPLGASKAEFGFYRPQRGAPRRLLDRHTRESDIFLPTSCRQTFASLWIDCPESPADLKRFDVCKGPVCSDACTVFRLYQRLLGPSGAFQERSRLFAPAPVPLEGMEKIKAMSATAADPNAKPLSATGPSASVPAPAAAARAVKKSKKELLADLPAEERIWLTDYVAPIVLPEEEKLFLELTEPHLRERFQREFWARRERDGLPYPLGTGYEARYPELRRLADEVYDGWRTDAGRMFMRYGEPAEIRKVRTCEHVFRDLEIWTYPGGVQGLGLFLFYRFDELQPRKLWDLNAPEREIFAGDSCRQRWEELAMDCPGGFQISDKCKGPVCGEACNVFRIYQSIRARQRSSLGATQERGRVIQPQPLSLEGIERIQDVSATAADPKAKPLSVTGPLGTVPAPAAAAPVVKRSKKELLADLPIEERSWLTEFVEPIIQPDEEQLFLELSRPEHFALFKEEFWKRRERDGLPFPMGPGYRGRYQELWRLAAEVYDGRQNDAGRMVLRFGEPASINPLEGSRMTFRDLEIWTYRQSAQAQGAMRHFFYRKFPGAPRKLWTYGTADSDVFSPGSCRKSFDELQQDCVPGPDKCFKSTELCQVWQAYNEIRMRQGSRTGAEVEWGRLLVSATVSTEGLESLRTRLLGAPFAGAPPPPPPLSRAERKSKRQLLAELPDEERAWLTSLVAPIILKEEEDLFLGLTEGYQWEIFKKEFWDRRELDSLGPPYGLGFKQRYEELRPLLDSVYDGWRNDAAQLVLHYGEPSNIDHVEGCDNVFRDLEIWMYPLVSGARGVNHHLLFRPSSLVPRKLWRMDIHSNASFDDVFVPKSPPWTWMAVGSACRGALVCGRACDVYRIYQEVVSRQGSYIGGMTESARLFKLPEISTEGLDRLRKRFATTADPNAKPLSVEGPTSKPRATPEPTPTPEPLRALTAEEIRDRIVHLELKYRQFLDLAGPLLTEDALQRFLQMTPKDKDRFIKEFWKRRA